VAPGFNKLLLAAAGIITMAIGWYALACLFYFEKPDLNSTRYQPAKYAGDSPEQRDRTPGRRSSATGAWNLILRGGSGVRAGQGRRQERARPPLPH
jgi:hypothetical protein